MRADAFDNFIKRVKPYISEQIELILKIDRPKFTIQQFYREFYKERIGPDSYWFDLSSELLLFINDLLKNPEGKIKRKDRKWTKEMIDVLTDDYPTKSKRWLREKLGLPWHSIKWKACKLKIKRRKRTK